MISIRRTITILVGAVLVLTAMTVTASDPVGIYAMVDKVVFEPSEAAPQRVQVWGVFALAVPPGDTYTAPARGYMYFSAGQGREAVAKTEWADLKSVVGTGQGVGFGARYTATGTVRKAGEKVANPDTYPVGGTGVVKVHPIPGYQNIMTNVIGQLKAAPKE
ncbi:MAG TPA: hypothetical protein VK210_11420 [Terriglobia bacterium]|nr:hypothetical protein [Terriglobia bacterium]